MTHLVDVLPSLSLPAALSANTKSHHRLHHPPKSQHHHHHHLYAQEPPSNSNVSSPPDHRHAPATTVARLLHGFLYLRDGLTHQEREQKRLRDERKQLLSARMQCAQSFKQWDAAAHELDALEGNDEWKDESLSAEYDAALLETRLQELESARHNRDLRSMTHLVRTALSRDLAGMDNMDLYRHSHCGTKKLIERYVDSALQTIDALVDQSARPSQQHHRPQHAASPPLEPKDVLEALLYARQSFGRSALLLSGGGTFGMSHVGVLKALFEANLLPRIISGASAGSIVCSVVCTRADDEIPALLDDFPYGELDVFEKEGQEEGLLDHLQRLLTEGSWSDIKHLTRVMRNMLGDVTFQEAYNRTRRICNICVSSASIYELPRLLNYVTAPNVMIWSAVAASCSVPLVFSAAGLLVKNPTTGRHAPWSPSPQMWIDGSVDNDLPMTRLAEMFNVNHFIVSQVNPHVVPFLPKHDKASSGSCSLPIPAPPPPSLGGHESASAATSHQSDSDWLHALTALAKSEALHRMQFMAEMGVFPNLVTKLRSILSQKYSGDINIIPALGLLELPRILRNPTTAFMVRLCLLGEQAAWPRLSRIRDRCAIELALDRAVHQLRARVVFSKSQVDLRRMAAGTHVTIHRGSHEPLATAPLPPEQPSSPDGEIRYRQRRSSGSHLPSNPRHLGLAHDSPYRMTDEDTDEEERLEMASRKPRTRPRMKIKRMPKNHPFHSGPSTSPALSSVTTDVEMFDFARPISPSQATSQLGRPSNLSRVRTVMDMENLDGQVGPSDTTSDIPAGDTELETSEMHTSDFELDSQTAEEATTTDEETAVVPPSKIGSPLPDARVARLEQDLVKSKVDMFSLTSRPGDGGSGMNGVIDPGADLWSRLG